MGDEETDELVIAALLLDTTDELVTGADDEATVLEATILEAAALLITELVSMRVLDIPTDELVTMTDEDVISGGSRGKQTNSLQLPKYNKIHYCV